LIAEHDRFDELAALAAGGYLSDEECREFAEHKRDCASCRRSVAELTEVFRVGLPLTRKPFYELAEKLRATPSDGFRERFLREAVLKGASFSQDVSKPSIDRTPRRCDCQHAP
jgi:hypothetical protein